MPDLRYDLLENLYLYFIDYFIAIAVYHLEFFVEIFDLFIYQTDINYGLLLLEILSIAVDYCELNGIVFFLAHTPYFQSHIWVFFAHIKGVADKSQQDHLNSFFIVIDFQFIYFFSWFASQIPSFFLRIYAVL